MKKKMFGQIGMLKDEKVREYKELHMHPWPGVLETIRESNMANYTIFLHGNLVFAYFEYLGEDYTADMKKMAGDTVTQEWWKRTKPCFVKYSMSGESEFYCDMEQIFHLE